MVVSCRSRMQTAHALCARRAPRELSKNDRQPRRAAHQRPSSNHQADTRHAEESFPLNQARLRPTDRRGKTPDCSYDAPCGSPAPFATELLYEPLSYYSHTYSGDHERGSAPSSIAVCAAASRACRDRAPDHECPQAGRKRSSSFMLSRPRSPPKPSAPRLRRARRRIVRRRRGRRRVRSRGPGRNPACRRPPDRARSRRGTAWRCVRPDAR